MVENKTVGQPYNPAVIFQKKQNAMTIFTMGFSFLTPGAYVDLGPGMGRTKWRRQETLTKQQTFSRFYTCQVSRLRRDCHACGSKTAISRLLTPAFPFLTPGGKV